VCEFEFEVSAYVVAGPAVRAACCCGCLPCCCRALACLAGRAGCAVLCCPLWLWRPAVRVRVCALLRWLLQGPDTQIPERIVSCEYMGSTVVCTSPSATNDQLHLRLNLLRTWRTLTTRPPCGTPK
jgi:hypothetical protein